MILNHFLLIFIRSLSYYFISQRTGNILKVMIKRSSMNRALLQSHLLFNNDLRELEQNHYLSIAHGMILLECFS